MAEADWEGPLAYFEDRYEEELLLRDHYKLLARIGHSKEGSVYKAKYLPNNTLVAIKIYDPYKIDNRQEYTRQLFLAHIFQGRNIVRILCRFKYQDHVWVVMDYMALGSVKSIMVNYFPNGLSEPSIACILKQTLMSCIEYGIHHINRNLNFGHLYVDANGDVKVGFDVVQYEELENQPNNLLTLPHWAYAPEAKGDAPMWEHSALDATWMLGVTALQLAYGGRLPASNERDWDLLIQNITAQYGPKRRKRIIRMKIPKSVKKFVKYYSPIPKHHGRKKLSTSFWEMVALCFQWRPRERPNLYRLTSHEFFTNNCSKFDDYPREPFSQEVLLTMPSLSSQELQHQEEGVDDEWSFYDELSRSSSFSFSSSPSSF